MEKKLKALFDYQNFEKNARLAKLIEETGSRYEGKLSDDDLGMVNAAGESDMSGGTISENTAEADNWYDMENQKNDLEPGSRFWIRWLGGDSQESTDKKGNKR